ncbi:MAG: tetratricopeptide repeat protein [Terriglobia bacterium]|jgi:tetratricopeptide (TPR) repeat protein
MVLHPSSGSRENNSDTAPRRGLARLATQELLALLIVIAGLPYLNSLWNGFVQDDNRQILANPYLRNFSHLREIFATNVWSYVGAQGLTNYYRPLMTLGYLISYQLFGPMAYGFHLANLVLNAAVVCLVFLVTERAFHNRTLGFVAAVIFALHPVHSESVDWIAAVTDLQLTFFYLLAFWFFLRVVPASAGGAGVSPAVAGASGSGTGAGKIPARRQVGRRLQIGWRGIAAQLGMGLCFALALLAKEPAATLPFLATFYEHFLRDDRERTTLTQKLARYLSLWLVDAAYLLFRIRIFGGLAPVLQLPQISRREAFYSSFALSAQYVWKIIWPVNLCGFYTFHKSLSLFDPRSVAGLVLLGLCLCAFVYSWKRERLVSFGLLWLFLNLAPVLNGRWLGANVFTERYLYLPSLGFCWIAAWGGQAIWTRLAEQRAARKVYAVALIIIAALCVVRIVTRNRVWRDDATFYQHTLAQQPDAVALRINLGAVYWNSGSPDQAEAEWRAALRRAPDHWLILNNLGLVAARKKLYDEAIEDFQRSIRFRPNYADSHINLGRSYTVTGASDKAEAQLKAAVSLAPLYVQARNALAEFYFDAGRFSEAEMQYRASVASGGTVQAWNSLGEIYSRWHRWQDAERAFRQALALDAFESRAHFGLGAVLEAEGRNIEALQEYTAGLQTDPRNPTALEAAGRLKKLSK